MLMFFQSFHPAFHKTELTEINITHIFKCSEVFY